ncbi:hypothetical protein [Sphingomonas beigongshangi]|uniref:hypothetical protein n=1 Tax=Sphingomonas beigongshangi TaxID=2782540 RepID=UPI001AED2979|nr:hypothetical protein [Sphingomonas beigongshangi]
MVTVAVQQQRRGEARRATTGYGNVKALHRATLTKVGRGGILFDVGEGHSPLDTNRVQEAGVVADHVQRSVSRAPAVCDGDK